MENENSEKITERDALLLSYDDVSAEITRYRDREWQNAGLFLAALAGLVAFVFSNREDAIRFRWQFDVAFLSLTIANVYYTCYAHNGLTRARILKNELSARLNLPVQKDTSWFRGFWSHLVPFFLATVAVAAFGFYILRNSR